MENNSSVKRNFAYQVVYTLVTMGIPVIVTPYLARTLMETEIGKFTYTRSIASYFVIFAMMGIAKYGQRVISQNSSNRTLLRKSFWSLFYVHACFSIASLVAFIVLASSIQSSEQILLWIQGIYVISAFFDITWLFYGLEDFKKVTITNTVIKILEASSYVLFIKTPEDIYRYALINCCAYLASQLVLFFGVMLKIKPIYVSRDECSVHIKPIMLFAVAVIGISLYTHFDTTLLGLLSTNESVAYYEYSNRIVRMPLSIASIIGTVLFPRMCRLVSQNNVAEQRQYIKVSLTVVSIIGAVAFWGFRVIGDPLAEIYLGERFKQCGEYLCALAPLVYVVGISDVVRTQLMIPNGMDKVYIKSIVLNAIVNLIISIVLIWNLPSDLQIYGAIWGTVVAETTGMIYQTYVCRNFVKMKDLLKIAGVSFAIGAVMFIFLRLLVSKVVWTITSLILTVILGVAIYAIIAILYIVVFERDLRKLLLRKK